MKNKGRGRRQKFGGHSAKAGGYSRPTKPTHIPPVDSCNSHSPPKRRRRSPAFAVLATGPFYLIITPLAHHDGVTSPSPRQAAKAALASAHRQPAHDRLGHPLGPQVHLASAPGQSPARPRRHACRPAPHRLVHQRPQPRRRLHPAHRAYHGQPPTPQLLPAAREARRGHLCHGRQERHIIYITY